MTDLNKLIFSDQIRTVMARYVYFADHKEWSKLASLFTEDGSFEPRNVDGNALITMNGRDTIATTISSRVKQAIAIHHLFSYEIEIKSSERANGIFAMEDYLIHPDYEEETDVSDLKKTNNHNFKTLHGFGHYHADFLKIDGIWFIEKLVQTRLKIDLTY